MFYLRLNTRLKWILLSITLVGSVLFASYHNSPKKAVSKVAEESVDPAEKPLKVIASNEKAVVDCAKEQRDCAHKSAAMKAPASGGSSKNMQTSATANGSYTPPEWYPNYQPVCITDPAHHNFGDFDPIACPDLVAEISEKKDLPPDPGKEGKASVVGIDANNNQIRDDVERYIEIVYDDESLEPVLEALKKEAVKYQKQLEFWESKETVLAITAENEIQDWCTIALMNEHVGDHYTRASKFFQAQVFNTYDRLLAWNRINAYYSGMVFSMPDDETLSASCNL